MNLQEVSRLLRGSNCGRSLEQIVLPDSVKALSSKHDFDLQVDTHLPRSRNFTTGSISNH